MSVIKVFGHKAPDTDSTCSAISFAWYLKNVESIDAEAFVLGKINKEAEFVLKKFGVEEPKLLETLTSEDEVAVVDTNNPEELPETIKDAKIKFILDHHKLSGGIVTDSPLYVTIKPFACSATIIFDLTKERGKEIPKEIAGLMLSAILSDTLKFTSPTTTDIDKKAAEELSKICGEDIEKLASDMFDAKSDLTGLTARDLILLDSKEYETKGKKVRYSVLETTRPENALYMKDEIIKEMEILKTEDSLDLFFFFVVNILKSEATLLVAGDNEKEIAEKAFKVKVSGDSVVLPGVVSRKKQIIPSIEPLIV